MNFEKPSQTLEAFKVSLLVLVDAFMKNRPHVVYDDALRQQLYEWSYRVAAYYTPTNPGTFCSHVSEALHQFMYMDYPDFYKNRNKISN